MRVAVVTCSHRGDDARIAHRQIRALLDAGHSVTLVAPDPTPFAHPGFEHVLVPRSVGRRRLGAWRAVRRALGPLRPDLVLVHDIELLPVIPRSVRCPLVWDVHEDYVAAASDRAWLPSWARGAASLAARVLERSAARRYRLIVAEESYRSRHPEAPVVPNTTVVPQRCAPPDPRADRIVYLGRISTSRGLREMIELGRRVRGDLTVELIGAVDAGDRAELEAAAAAGDVVWAGYVPNDVALDRVDGALVGLSLLHDAPNFVHSMPTKLIEYLAHGVPVISTRLPVAVPLVEAVDGTLVDIGDVDAVERAARALAADAAMRERLGRRGHAYVREHRNWTNDGPVFVALIEAAARR